MTLLYHVHALLEDEAIILSVTVYRYTGNGKGGVILRGTCKLCMLYWQWERVGLYSVVYSIRIGRITIYVDVFMRTIFCEFAQKSGIQNLLRFLIS